MAITFLEKRKRLEYLVPILVVLFFLTIVILWQGFFTSKVATHIFDIDTFEEVPQRIEIDFQALKDPFLDTLVPFEEIVPWEGTDEDLGRENPFLPYRLGDRVTRPVTE